ncbi:COG3628 Phage baseplate assembly protein W [uncultured Caudovirales phage]|uniref:COG3628 Phage baseplate assembly protein W n=1 Tax=uncultured Caudovirales phage TaxID=2100421 RepID=A0A6J5QLL0_9CAUD|nr:COG3628 Phage baseplate assembly protein W [uncultured Caudovirales phage]CAB4193176.1 COG3628 Phage baseplate assembly protein W [uncultured Caudovirales phage]CAB4217809.1 COG3628 Phage baseplate assembly protein W [uncultured Caudovirales phage]CAB5231630.1 COG3628 Phage baseplate assembly protein W [uncultured Caudovirales phage]
MTSTYLGTALSNPPRLSSGAAVLTVGVPAIEDSVADILSTPVGTRFFLPEYGCRLESVMFEPNDEILINLVPTLIVEALAKWETRIRTIDIQCAQQNDYLSVTINYKVLASSEIKTFIYPFYNKLVY